MCIGSFGPIEGGCEGGCYDRFLLLWGFVFYGPTETREMKESPKITLSICDNQCFEKTGAFIILPSEQYY